MKKLNVGLLIASVSAFVAVMLPMGGPGGLLFMAGFCLWPHAVQWGLICLLRGNAAQWLLAAATLSYAGCFAYLYMNVVVWHPDPQSPIAFLFSGVYALPVLLPLWGAAWLVAGRRRGGRSPV